MNPAQPLPTTSPRSLRRSRAAKRTIPANLHLFSHIATIALVVCFVVFLAILATMTVYGITHAGKAYSGVTIAGIDVSGKDRNEIHALVDQKFYEYEHQPITLVANDQEFSGTLADLGVSIDRTATIERAFSYGRSGSWWDRSIAWANGFLYDHDFDPVVAIDQDAFVAHLQFIAPDIVRAPQDAYVQVLGSSEPALVADVPGVSINVVATRARLIDHVENLRSEPVALSLVSVPARVNSDAIASGLPQAQRAVSSSINLQSDEGMWPIEPDELKALVWVDDNGELNVHEDEARAVVENVAAEIDHPSQDANITVDGDGNFIVVPAVYSAEVDVDATTTALSQSLIEGNGNVSIRIERKAPQITDDMAEEWAARADALAGQGVTVSWDNTSATITRAELIWAMVIEPRPGEAEPFRLYFDKDILTEQLQPIVDTVSTTPKNAQFRLVDGEIKLHKEAIDGVTVDVQKSVDAVDKAANDGSFRAKLSIKHVKPDYTSADRDSINLYDLLGDSSTWYGDSSVPRRHNVERAVDLESGWIIAPGEEFSYAAVMGLVTPENGFVTGYGIVADPNGGPGGVTTAPVIGGGICQVSTTIFQAAFWAGLEITERYQHPYWLLNYGEPPRGMKGLDAMVNIEPDWSLDLKFRNNTGNWIALVMTADGQTVGARIVGTDPGWIVDVNDPVITNVVKSDPTKMIYTDSPELPKGQMLQVEYAKDGFDSSIKRTVRDKDGNTISTYTLESSYAASRNTTLRGTGTNLESDTGPANG